MQYFNATLNQTIILFTFIICGFVLRRSGVVGDGSSSVLSKLEASVFIPALIINTFMTRFTVENIKNMYSYILWASLLLAVAFPIGVALSRVFAKDRYTRRIYIYSMSIANFGFMGNAVVLGAFGEDMLFRYMLFTIPINMFTYSIGVAMLKPDFRLSIRTFANPVVFSLIIGAVLGLTGLGTLLPSFIESTVSMVAACMSPIAMILTGMVVAEYKICELIKNGKVYICTVLRLLIIPALFVGILYLFGVNNDNYTITLAICAFAMPLGLNTVVYPSAYGADTKLGASMALISHSISIITIPVMFLIFT